MAGETLTCADACDKSFCLGLVVKHLSRKDVPIEVKVDCKSLFDCVMDHRQVTEKRLSIDIALLREMLHNKQVGKIMWVPTHLQLAD